ncbi:MAG: hypothetical protein M5U09_13625 [Gammaproteobacteria bacterium]|nr:hypothetical protein [Gammaproteobacteria bacterium]
MNDGRSSTVVTSWRHRLRRTPRDPELDDVERRDDGYLVHVTCPCCAGEFLARVVAGRKKAALQKARKTAPPTWWCPRWRDANRCDGARWADESATNPPPGRKAHI